MFRGHILHYFRFGLLLPALLCFETSHAQIELSADINLGFPFLTNSGNNNLLYNQLSFGIRGGISFKPTNTQFFPTLNYGIGVTRLPLKQFQENVAYINMTYQSLVLNGNMVFAFGENNNSLYVIGGIGFIDLQKSSFGISGKNSDAMLISLKSSENITSTLPVMAIGLEYVYGAGVNKNIYMSLGLKIQNIILLKERNTYTVNVTDFQQNNFDLKADLSGIAIMPDFYICLHYMLGNSLIFWQKKKNTMYL